MEHDPTNGINPTTAKRWIEEAERCYVDLATEQGTYMSRCRVIRDRLKDIKERAEADGLGRTAFNKVLDLRKLERKKVSIIADLSEDVIETIEQMTEALGPIADLPLGEWAKETAPKAATTKPAKAPRKSKSAALDSLISDDIPPDDEVPDPDAEHVQANIDALSSMKELH